jgi:hypothetical protein
LESEEEKRFEFDLVKIGLLVFSIDSKKISHYKHSGNAVNLRSSSIDNIMLSFSTMKFSIKNSIFNNWNSMF